MFFNVLQWMRIYSNTIDCFLDCTGLWWKKIGCPQEQTMRSDGLQAKCKVICQNLISPEEKLFWKCNKQDCLDIVYSTWLYKLALLAWSHHLFLLRRHISFSASLRTCTPVLFLSGQQTCIDSNGPLITPTYPEKGASISDTQHWQQHLEVCEGFILKGILPRGAVIISHYS